MPRVVMFVFAGREENISIALPSYRRILEENPHVELDIWDLARDPKDSAYLRSIKGERIRVRTEFYRHDGRSGLGQVEVWRHYAQPEYADCVFAKLDDDDLFIETGAFRSFIQAATDNPDHVVSALTINNGASTSLLPEVWAGFEQLGIHLLDVHMSTEYAELSHRWFFQNWRTITGRPAMLTPVETWVSINCISYTYEMGCRIASLLGTRPPIRIADREYLPRNPRGRPIRHRVGDEGAVNMMPRLIHEGMVVGHLSFGPQKMSDELLAELRTEYAKVACAYLGGLRRTVKNFADDFVDDLEIA